MANNSIYGNANTGGLNQYGFKPQPIQDNSASANFLQSGENQAAARASQANTTGTATTAQGTQALAPLLSYLTKLTQGDQADVSQAIQPELNRVKDSFQAARSMISGQPRGGGKTSALAESQFKESQATGDLAQKARQGAASELGQVGSTLAGIGLEEQSLSGADESLALQTLLSQRNQNMTAGSFASQFNQIAQGVNALV